jgi:CheY-like chemotaxis protein
MTIPERPSNHGPAASDADKPTIAVIDDEHKWLKVFKRIFHNSPYGIDTYADPRLFLDTIMEHPQKYAGIICDIKMPQMDGYQVFEAIKGNKATQNIPFVIVSGVLTQGANLCKVQNVAYISKLDDNLRSRIFHELIEVIENWPKIKQYLRSQHVSEEKIDFFCQFFINYHKFFNEILTYVNKMELACVSADPQAIANIRTACDNYMAELQNTCMELISLMQDSLETTAFIRKVCERGRTCSNMIQTFQLLLAEEPTTNAEFRSFLTECRDSLEKIVVGSEKGYNLRVPE